MCGLSGFIFQTPKKFDKRAFLTLAVNNDTRGGDACGIYIDGKVDYGTGDKKLFSSYYRESQLINETQYAAIAVSHCRKASIGGTGADKAQPITLTDENGKIVFTLLHNGTIHNYEALAKKYIPEVNIKNMSDTQVLAKIFCHAGYDCLGEYNGGGVFVIIDEREETPKILFFQGESKEKKYSKVTSIERPFYYKEIKNGIVFSSIPTYLDTLYPGKPLYIPPTNELCEIIEGRFYSIKKYDRLEKVQEKEYTYVASQPYNHYTGKRSLDDADFDYDDYYDDYYSSRYNQNKHSVGSPSSDTPNSKANNSKENSLILVNPDSSNKCTTIKEDTNLKNNFIELKASQIGAAKLTENHSSGYVVRDDDGFYVMNNKLCHGEQYLDAWGIAYCKPKTTSTVSDTTTCYFWLGILLYNKECYEYLVKVAGALKLNAVSLYMRVPWLAPTLSFYPIRDEILDRRGLMVSTRNQMTIPYSGNLIPPFHGRTIQYHLGVEQNTHMTTGAFEQAFALLIKNQDYTLNTQIFDKLIGLA